MEAHQTILEPCAVEIDEISEIPGFHDSQDSYMREISDPNIYSKFNIVDPIDTPVWYQANSPTHESELLTPFSNPPTPNQSIPIPTSSYTPNNSPLYPYTAHHAYNPDSLDSTDSAHSVIFPHSSDLVERDLVEPICVVCLKGSSNAHQCPGCQHPVHTICGFPVAGLEGFGSPVWCLSCYLEEREDTMEQGRKRAKHGQEKQIARMEKQSIKKARILEIGNNVLLPIPEVDKRSPFDPLNLLGVITHRSEEGYYKIGTQAGEIDRCYLSTEFEFTPSNFLSPEEVPESIVTLRKAILVSSLGKNRLACNCTSGCGSNRCRCRRSKKLCNSVSQKIVLS